MAVHADGGLYFDLLRVAAGRSIWDWQRWEKWRTWAGGLDEVLSLTDEADFVRVCSA